MTESIQKYFNVGTIQWMSYPRMDPMDSLLAIARDDFFDAIEVGKMPDDATREKVRDMLAQSHLKVCYGAQPRLLGPKLNPNALEEEERLKAAQNVADLWNMGKVIYSCVGE